MEDEALRREREDSAMFAGELEQRSGVGRQQHRLEVVEEHRDRGRAFDLRKRLPRGRDQILGVVEVCAQQARQNFGVELAPTHELWMERLYGRPVVTAVLAVLH